MEPTLTVMMPVYNAAPYLEAAVESILAQTLSNIRVLIIDDGSDDGSGEILDRLARTDARIELVRRGRRGQIATRNELLLRAGTDIVACADADDVSRPDRLARQLAIFERDPALVVLGCQMCVIDAGGRPFAELRKPVGAALVRTALKRGTAIAQPSCMMRRKAVLAMGGYRGAYEHAEDYDFFLRASEFGKVDNADFIGVNYRAHAGSVSHRHAIRQLASADLARSTHLLRTAGEADPTTELANAPAFDHPVMKALVASTALYRALAAIDARAGTGPLRVLLAAHINRKQSRHVQRAIMEAVRQRRFDALSARALVRAATLGPGRLVRLYYSRHLARNRHAYGQAMRPSHLQRLIAPSS